MTRAPTLHWGPGPREATTVGEILRAARLDLGLTQEDVAELTKVRVAYIDALESFDFDRLPARPFVVGYVRAYARTLRLDAEAIVARFHAEAPRVDGKLRAPGGVRSDTFASIRVLAIIGAVVATAVIGWNFARRAQLRSVAPVTTPVNQARPRAAGGTAQIGLPLPTPPEATTPPVYQTPGLDSSLPPGAAPAGAGGGVAKVAGGLIDPGPGAPGARFQPTAAVFGAPANQSAVTLQARKSVSLVVRGAGGAITFARLLGAGEAWRAARGEEGVVDVSDPAAVEVFVDGVSRGRLVIAQTPVGKLQDP